MKRVYKCAICHEPGHTAKKCVVRPSNYVSPWMKKKKSAVVNTIQQDEVIIADNNAETSATANNNRRYYRPSLNAERIIIDDSDSDKEEISITTEFNFISPVNSIQNTQNISEKSDRLVRRS